MAAAPDYLGALKTALLLDAAVAAASAGRVYVGELPRESGAVSFASLMPRAAVLVQPAGGSPERGYARLSYPRIDVRSYGRTPNEAWRLSLVVHDYLKNLARKVAAASSTGERALIHDATPVSGGSLLRDADGDWPMALRTYELVVSETAVP